MADRLGFHRAGYTSHHGPYGQGPRRDTLNTTIFIGFLETNKGVSKRIISLKLTI